MPKRSYDALDEMHHTSLNIPPGKVQKTERSHEENQERAYIAASRRADRSLEARVQSAKMASDIHRKRTGRRLRVSEEIVQREEMYEEMEDEIPLSYRHLTAHLRAGPERLNNRFDSYLMNNAAAVAALRYNEIDQVFNRAFPSAGGNGWQQPPASIYMSPLVNNTIPSPRSGSVSCHGSASCPSSRNQSISTPSYSSEVGNSLSGPSPSLTPATASAMTPNPMPQSPFSTSFPLDPDLAHLQPQQLGNFASQLPSELDMSSVNVADPITMHFFGEGTPPFPTGCDAGIPVDQFDLGKIEHQGSEPPSREQNDGLYSFLDPTCDFDPCGTPVFESFIDFDGEK